MRAKFLFFLVMSLCAKLCVAQTTGLFVTEESYYVKNGETWTVYQIITGAKGEYVQYNADDSYYYLKMDSSPSVAIPKKINGGVYTYDKDQKKWKDEPTWNLIGRYDYFDSDNGGKPICCFQGGYLVKTNSSTWKEYRPELRSGVYDTYDEVKTEGNLKVVENADRKIKIPSSEILSKFTDGSYAIKEYVNGEWIDAEKLIIDFGEYSAGRMKNLFMEMMRGFYE